MKERKTLVTSFSELRVGMIVVYGPCSNCKRMHRAMLTNPAPGWTITGEEQPSLLMLPQPQCSDGDQELGIGPITVDNKVVYRIDDGLDKDSSRQRRGTQRRPARTIDGRGGGRSVTPAASTSWPPERETPG